MSDWINKRAGGRRRYNADRQGKAWLRRVELAECFNLMALVRKTGAQQAAADHFGVSPATICRDVRAIFRLTTGGDQVERKALRLMCRRAVQG